MTTLPFVRPCILYRAANGYWICGPFDLHDPCHTAIELAAHQVANFEFVHVLDLNHCLRIGVPSPTLLY